MDQKILDDLITIEKKSDAPNAKKEEFVKLITELLNEEGYSERAEKYAIGGFSFIGMKPVVDWVVSHPEIDCYSLIRKGKIFSKNENGISFKVTLSVFAFLINNNKFKNSDIENIIKDIPRLSKNKEGKRFGSYTKSIEKYFIMSLSQNASLPRLSELDIHPNFIITFVELIKESICTISTKNDKETAKIIKVQQWISEKKEEADTSNDESQLDKQKSTKKKSFNARVLLEAAQYFDNLEKEFFRLRKESESQNSLVQNIKNENLKLKEEQLLTTKELKALKENVENLLFERTKLTEVTKSLRNALQAKEEEVLHQRAILTVFESSKRSSQQEQLNMIASKLKSEYCDFQDALQMDMSIELGENMRQQIKEIFKILTKNGIDIENR